MSDLERAIFGKSRLILDSDAFWNAMSPGLAEATLDYLRQEMGVKVHFIDVKKSAEAQDSG